MNYKIKYLGNGERPKIAVIGCVHGDELIGKKIISKLEKLNIKKGTLGLILANPRAIEVKKRFIDQDLNRSFPGNAKGNHEEKLAHELKEKLNEFDFVLDIHSTVTDTKDLIIITKSNKKILDLIAIFKPKRVALMKRSISRKALTYHCKAGISFEYGKDKDLNVLNKIEKDILYILGGFGVTKNKLKEKNNKIEFYKIEGMVLKDENDRLSRKIRNFKLIKKGEAIAKSGREVVSAKKDFYPVLFGGKSYKDIFGFEAEKVEKFD